MFTLTLINDDSSVLCKSECSFFFTKLYKLADQVRLSTGGAPSGMVLQLNIHALSFSGREWRVGAGGALLWQPGGGGGSRTVQWCRQGRV